MSTTKQARLVEAAIKKIEEHYRMGCMILEECGVSSPRGEIGRLATQLKVNRDTAQKLRSIANPEAGYTRRELDQLYNQFREKGRALTITHFVKLVSVPRGQLRKQLTDDSLNLEWSAQRLQAEIVARLGRRRTGGRKPTVIEGDSFSGELERTMWAWMRWLDLHLEANPGLRPELAKELKAMKRLIGKVNKLLAQ